MRGLIYKLNVSEILSTLILFYIEKSSECYFVSNW